MQESGTSFSLTRKEFLLFKDLIYKDAGISLSDAKMQLVESRLSKRLRACHVSTYMEYYQLLMNGDSKGEERLRMINSLTTNKTDFFREQHHFEYLRSTVFPAIEQRARETGERKIRIWSAACSTGEEPYTLAMTVLDHFGPTSFHGWDIRILASDVDTDVLAHAQKGVYPSDRVADVPRDALRKHFLKTSKQPDAPLQVRPELQELITFRRINFVEPTWPIQTAFDIIFCRNVMIYFDEPTQDRLLTRFSAQLKPEGHLFIGHSESILRLDDLYQSLGNTIYRLSPQSRSASQTKTPAAAGPGVSISKEPETRAQSITKQPSPRRSPVAASAQNRPVRNSPGVRPDKLTDESGDKLPVHAIIVGDVKASADPLRITTLVGSCIAVCLFDARTRIGGMNHFMLPRNPSVDKVCATYGMHAMELLINEIMKLGGDRRRLQAKVFGGGNVLGKREQDNPVCAIGDQNIGFALKFLETDNIPIVSQDLGGFSGRQVQFLTHTGQAFVRPVQKVMEEIEGSQAAQRRTRRRPPADAANVVLF
jgi:chemotaxis protein methyltransferase CheR